MQIGWIDFSKEHRSKVMSVLDMLAKPGAVDELGVAVIRDRFADILFPGTSTIQTRAKYFLIVPWLMSELEREKGLNAVQFERKLHDEEIKLIYTLAKDGVWGVIGIDAKEKLKRKPSDIYWNGLKTYEIFIHRNLTLSEYISAACTIRDTNDRKKSELLQNGDDGKDDKDAFAADSLSTFWSIIQPETDWKQNLNMKLKTEEAAFIKHKILTSKYSKDSMWAYILRDFGDVAMGCRYYSDLEDIARNMPPQVYADYSMARGFADIIYGAHIRYNILFFEALKKDNEDVLMKWNSWKYEMKHYFDFSRWDTDALFYRINVNDYRLRHFIRSWVNYARDVDNINLNEMDELIRKREIALKGLERSKLKNSDEFTGFEGNWLGLDKLQFRWHSAKQLLGDILEGLGEANVKTRQG